MKNVEILAWIITFVSTLAFTYSFIRLKRNISLAKKKLYDYLENILKKNISINELGVIEKSILNLSDIIVPCNCVDKPRGILIEAIERNMELGVRYTFLVSPDNYETSKETYYQYFLAIAKSVSWKSENLTFNDLVRIRPLKKQWDFYPHIFYKTKEGENGVEATIAYRGNEKGVGLCRNYTLLNPDDAIMAYHYLMESAVIWSDKDKEMLSLIFTIEEKEFVEGQVFAQNNFPRLLKRRAV